MNQELDFIENFKLPRGGYYTGQCHKNLPFVELMGKGKAMYPDGSKYEGNFNYGRPYGIGKYTWADGDYHYGEFDDLPNGLGIDSIGKAQYIGNFVDGKLNGWGLMLKGNIKFGWWENGNLIKDESILINWVLCGISNRIRHGYEGNLIHFMESQNSVTAYFGMPPKKEKGSYPGALSVMEVLGLGFRFTKGGMVIVGEESSFTNNGYEISGRVAIYYPNGEKTSLGDWEDGKFIRPRRPIYD